MLLIFTNLLISDPLDKVRIRYLHMILNIDNKLDLIVIYEFHSARDESVCGDSAAHTRVP